MYDVYNNRDEKLEENGILNPSFKLILFQSGQKRIRKKSSPKWQGLRGPIIRRIPSRNWRKKIDDRQEK